MGDLSLVAGWPNPSEDVLRAGQVVCRQRLGGLLKSYYKYKVAG